MNESIKQTIMRRDELSSAEADDLIEEAREAFKNYLIDNDQDGAENVCQEYFGLEPDYIFDLI